MPSTRSPVMSWGGLAMGVLLHPPSPSAGGRTPTRSGPGPGPVTHKRACPISCTHMLTCIQPLLALARARARALLLLLTSMHVTYPAHTCSHAYSHACMRTPEHGAQQDDRALQPLHRQQGQQHRHPPLAVSSLHLLNC